MAINYEKFILDEKVNKIKSYDAQLEHSVLSESITDIYIKRREEFDALTESIKNMSSLTESDLADYRVLQEASSKVDYDYYTKMLDAQYNKSKKYINKMKKYNPAEKAKIEMTLEKRYNKAKKYFDKMKNSDDVLTKIKRFFDKNGSVSQGKVSELMINYLIQGEKDELDNKVKKSSDSMNESVVEFEAMISNPMEELDEFIINECAGYFNDPYSLIESAYDDQYEDPMSAAQKLIDAAELLQDI